MKMLVYGLVTGLLFGFLLQKGRVLRYDKQLGALRLGSAFTVSTYVLPKILKTYHERLPGVETTSGPLGSGLSQASGYAYAARMDGKTFRVFCAMSDGEQEEGNTWEAAMFAGKQKSKANRHIERLIFQISRDYPKKIDLEGKDYLTGILEEMKIE